MFVTNLSDLSKKNQGMKLKVNPTKYDFSNEAHSTESATIKFGFPYCKMQVWG
jgi:hypothetical protein